MMKRFYLFILISLSGTCFPTRLSAQDCVPTDTTLNWITYHFDYPDGVNLKRCKVVNEAVIWASSDRVFTTTQDGGCTWFTSRIDLLPDLELLHWDFSALDAQHVLAICYDDNNQVGRAFRTQDGGNTWEEILQDAFKLPGAWIDGVHYFDADHAVVFGDATDGYYEVMVTDDGGDTWSRVPASQFPPLVPDELYFFVWFYETKGDTIWSCSNKGRCWRSTDRGHHWTVTDILPEPPADWDNINIAFRDAQHGIAISSSEGPFVTSDGGETWTAQPGESNANFNLESIPGSNVYHMSNVYSLTYDDAQTWIYYYMLYDGWQPGFVHFLHSQYAWATGGTNLMHQFRFRHSLSSHRRFSHAKIKKEDVAVNPIPLEVTYLDYLWGQGEMVETVWTASQQGNPMVSIADVHTLSFGEMYTHTSDLYLPPVTGAYDLTGQGAVIGSGTPLFSLEGASIVTDTLASAADDSSEDVFGFSGPDPVLSRYNLGVADTLTAMSMYYLGPHPNTGAYCDLEFVAFDIDPATSLPDQLLWTSETIDLTPAQVGTYIYAVVPGGLPLPAGSYAFGLRALCPSSNGFNLMGADIDHRDPGMLFFFDGSWSLDDFWGDDGSMMMNLHFAEIVPDIPNALPELNPDEWTMDIFPNPSAGPVYLSAQAPAREEYAVQLLNALGEVVFTGKVAADSRGELHYSMDLSFLAGGVYFLVLSGETHRFTGKLIRRHP